MAVILFFLSSSPIGEKSLSGGGRSQFWRSSAAPEVRYENSKPINISLSQCSNCQSNNPFLVGGRDAGFSSISLGELVSFFRGRKAENGRGEWIRG